MTTDTHLAQQIGELIGEVKVLGQSINQRIDDGNKAIGSQIDHIRDDIANLKQSQGARMDKIENRVQKLEEAESEMGKLMARYGVSIGLGAAALTAGAIELLKRVH